MRPAFWVHVAKHATDSLASHRWRKILIPAAEVTLPILRIDVEEAESFAYPKNKNLGFTFYAIFLELHFENLHIYLVTKPL